MKVKLFLVMSLLCSSVFAEPVEIPDFKEESLPLLNKRLRELEDKQSSCILGFAASGGVGIAAGTTKYAAFMGGAFGTTNWNSTEANRQHIIPYTGTAKNLYIRTTGAQPGAGALVFTVRKNGVDTDLTITIAANEAAGTKTDLANKVSFSAGDLICLKGVNGDGADTSALINQWSLEFVKK